MDQSRWATDVGKLSISDNQADEDTLASPSRKQTSKSASAASQPPKTPTNRPQSGQVSQTADAGGDSERDAALRFELQSLRRINTVVEGVTASLDKATSNMETTQKTLSSAHTLLDTWTRILSQTEHMQRLILNPAWGGATQDLAQVENEALRRAREQERREAEAAERRRVEEERRRDEQERSRVEAEKRAAASVRPASGLRGRGIGRAGGASGRTTPGKAPPGTGASKSGRGATAGYGRVGSIGTRGRGRGRGVG